MADQQVRNTAGDNVDTGAEPLTAAPRTEGDGPTKVLQRELPTTGAENMIDVPVPITSSEIDEDPDDESKMKKAKDTVVGGLKKLRGDKDTAIGRVKILRMSKEDYARYWARDNDGIYIGTEPEGEGRRLWADELKK